MEACYDGQHAISRVIAFDIRARCRAYSGLRKRARADAHANPDRHDSCVDYYTRDHSLVRASKDSYTKTDTNGFRDIPIV